MVTRSTARSSGGRQPSITPSKPGGLALPISSHDPLQPWFFGLLAVPSAVAQEGGKSSELVRALTRPPANGGDRTGFSCGSLHSRDDQYRAISRAVVAL